MMREKNINDAIQKVIANDKDTFDNNTFDLFAFEELELMLNAVPHLYSTTCTKCGQDVEPNDCCQKCGTFFHPFCGD